MICHLNHNKIVACDWLEEKQEDKITRHVIYLSKVYSEWYPILDFFCVVDIFWRLLIYLFFADGEPAP